MAMLMLQPQQQQLQDAATSGDWIGYLIVAVFIAVVLVLLFSKNPGDDYDGTGRWKGAGK